MKLLFSGSLIATVTWWSLWFNSEQQGQRLCNRGDFVAAANTFREPMRQGTAWYRAGEFDEAEQAFAQDTSAEAEFNRGNCLIMQGKYEVAAERFERALALRPDWQDARINRDIAFARASLLQRDGGDMGDQQIGADEIQFDKTKRPNGQETQMESQRPLSDSEIQALWLRRVQSSPAEFLKSKFAYQLATKRNVETTE